MQPLPTEDIRSNRGTWAIPNHALPMLGHWMHDALPNEPYDPHFHGQEIETYYFDTRNYDLRKARVKKDQYCTLRVRCYGENDTYALSAKTESEKFRVEIPSDIAEGMIGGDTSDWEKWLPPSILGHLLGLVDLTKLLVVVKVCCHRYAIENDTDRYTLDVHVHTNHGKCLPFNVLEYKSTQQSDPPSQLSEFNPIKLSKFLWATEV